MPKPRNLNWTRQSDALWPDTGQELLIRASVLTGDPAVRAWLQWRSTNELDRLDHGAHRLLPKLYRNLTKLGIDDPLIDDLRRIAWQYRVSNALALEHLAQVLERLASANVDALVLKGAAVALQYYEEAGIRPMKDVDILTRPADVPAAAEVLSEAGWTCEQQSPGGLARFLHALPWRHPSGYSLDHHQYLTLFGAPPATEAGLWQRAIPIDVYGSSAKTISPTDLLFHVCVHGRILSEHPSSHWVVDAAEILRSAREKIDWPLMLEQARQRELTLPLGDALAYLQSLLGGVIPDNVLAAAAAEPIGHRERVKYRVMTRTPRSPVQAAQRIGSLYHEAARAAGVRRSPLGLARFSLRFYQYSWHLSSPWQVPVRALGLLKGLRHRGPALGVG